ncbi:MAG: hypothetical protein B6U72_03975 [Candidatus Altiarchaeales archaeon ex4484_2]|nr:MAG: hypothetical protein B6U72_03975 [Candidatus Altiarchaeales archaeon ex4484_2]
MAQLSKKLFGLLLIAVVLFCSGCAEKRQTETTLGPGDYSFTIEHQGIERFYLMHVPEGYDENNPTPLVFAFHGRLGNGRYMKENYNFLEESNKKGFIVVFPVIDLHRGMLGNAVHMLSKATAMMLDL